MLKEIRKLNAGKLGCGRIIATNILLAFLQLNSIEKRSVTEQVKYLWLQIRSYLGEEHVSMLGTFTKLQVEQVNSVGS